MNKYMHELESNIKYILHANYASPETIHINPNMVIDNAIVIFYTTDNEYLIGYENKDQKLSKFNSSMITIKNSILNKSSEYFSIKEGDYCGTYVVEKFISNDEKCTSVKEFFEAF